MLPMWSAVAEELEILRTWFEHPGKHKFSAMHSWISQGSYVHLSYESCSLWSKQCLAWCLKEAWSILSWLEKFKSAHDEQHEFVLSSFQFILLALKRFCNASKYYRWTSVIHVPSSTLISLIFLIIAKIETEYICWGMAFILLSLPCCYFIFRKRI